MLLTCLSLRGATHPNLSIEDFVYWMKISKVSDSSKPVTRRDRDDCTPRQFDALTRTIARLQLGLIDESPRIQLIAALQDF